MRERQRRDPQRNAERWRKWRIANPERANELRARYGRQHPDTYADSAACQRARFYGTPYRHRDIAAVRRVYRCAKRISELTGIPHTVDHIQPLSRGGAHDETNICVMPAQMNNAKRSQSWPSLQWFTTAHATLERWDDAPFDGDE